VKSSDSKLLNHVRRVHRVEGVLPRYHLIDRLCGPADYSCEECRRGRLLLWSADRQEAGYRYDECSQAGYKPTWDEYSGRSW
jgi:hypothetical protein